jgi:23S rRNA pseudouridine1911/1915/1917 synthase
MAQKIICRIYTAIIWGTPIPPSGTIDVALGRSRKNRQKMAVLSGTQAQRMYGEDVTGDEENPRKQRHGKHAVTHYETLENFGLIAARVACQLETGRTHQIRVHLAHLGHAVVGDPTYGNAKGWRDKLQTLIAKNAEAKKTAAAQFILDFPRQALHAAEISFTHPVTGKAIHKTAPLPEDMKALVKALKICTG